MSKYEYSLIELEDRTIYKLHRYHKDSLAYYYWDESMCYWQLLGCAQGYRENVFENIYTVPSKVKLLTRAEASKYMKSFKMVWELSR